MRRRKGIGGMIFGLLTFVVLAGIFFAVMRQFDGDFIEAVVWCFDYIIGLIGKVADKFTEMPGFRQLFK